MRNKLLSFLRAHSMVQPGDTVIVGSRSVHCPEIESGCVYERIIIYISPEYLQLQSTPDCDLLELFSGQRGHILRPGESGSRKLLAMAGELEKEAAQTKLSLSENIGNYQSTIGSHSCADTHKAKNITNRKLQWGAGMDESFSHHA